MEITVKTMLSTAVILALTGCSSKPQDTDPDQLSLERQVQANDQKLEQHLNEWSEIKPDLLRLTELEADMEELVGHLTLLAEASAKRSGQTRKAQMTPSQPSSQIQRIQPAAAPIENPTTLYLGTYRNDVFANNDWQEVNARFAPLLGQVQMRTQPITLSNSRKAQQLLLDVANAEYAQEICHQLIVAGYSCRQLAPGRGS